MKKGLLSQPSFMHIWTIISSFFEVIQLYSWNTRHRYNGPNNIFVVILTGFEPVNGALRGHWVKQHPVLDLVAFLSLSTSKQLVTPCPPLICFSYFSRAGPLILRESSHGVCAHNFAPISFKIRRKKTIIFRQKRDFLVHNNVSLYQYGHKK